MCPLNDGVEVKEYFLLLCQSKNRPTRSAILPLVVFRLFDEVRFYSFILHCDERLTIDTNKNLLEPTQISFMLQKASKHSHSKCSIAANSLAPTTFLTVYSLFEIGLPGLVIFISIFD